MSHVASVEIDIKDLDCLKAACKAIGLEFRENQKSYKWYGRWMNDYAGKDAAYKHGVQPKDYGKCDHAIGVPGNKQAYEIGVVKNDKSYKLVWDFYCGGFGLEALAGKDCGKLVQNYAAEVAKKHLKTKGYTVGTPTLNKDGTMELMFTHY